MGNSNSVKDEKKPVDPKPEEEEVRVKEANEVGAEPPQHKEEHSSDSKVNRDQSK